MQNIYAAILMPNGMIVCTFHKTKEKLAKVAEALFGAGGKEGHLKFNGNDTVHLTGLAGLETDEDLTFRVQQVIIL